MALIHLFILFLISHVHASLSLITDGETMVTVPTFNYFEYPSKNFTSQGYPVMARLIPSDPDIENPEKGTCSIKFADALPDDDQLKSINQNYKESIMVMQWISASKCGAVVLSQLWPLAKEFAAMIETAGLPPSNTLVVGLSTKYKGTEVNPYREKYRSVLAGVDDGPPPKDLHVVMFGLGSSKKFIAADKEYRASAKVAEYVVEWEMDPWNKMFSGALFQVFKWFFFLVNAGFIVFSCYHLGLVIREGKFHFDLRNAVFLLGMIGATLFCVTLLLPIRSRSRRLISNVSGFCETMAFHLLLYLWSVFMQQIQRSKNKDIGIMVFRGIVFTSMFVVTFSFVAQMVMHNMRINKGVRTMASIAEYALPIMQFIIALTFASYSIQFYNKRETVKISPHTQQALFRLTVLAGIAFGCYMCISILNIQALKNKLQQTPGGALFAYILQLIAFTMRDISLLAVLGIRSPRADTSKSDATSSIASRSRLGSVSSIQSTRKG